MKSAIVFCIIIVLCDCFAVPAGYYGFKISSKSIVPEKLIKCDFEYSMNGSEFLGDDRVIVRLLDRKGTLISEASVLNPLMQRVLDNTEKAVEVMLDSSSIYVCLPVSPDGVSISITTPSGLKSIIPVNRFKLDKESTKFDLVTIKEAGPKDKYLNTVILGDGYTSEELDKFVLDATNAYNGIVNCAPFSDYKSMYNFYAIKVPSAETGCKPVPTATAPDTYFNSSYFIQGIDRLLLARASDRIYSVLAGSFPASVNNILVVVNNLKYGGSGGNYATFSIHADSKDLAIHEMAHSFADLADEYGSFTMEKANLTSINAPDSIRWKPWIGTTGVGIYKTLATPVSYYKPSNGGCKMEYLAKQFCKVCSERLILAGYNKVKKITEYSPIGAINANNQQFKIKHLVPSQFAKVEWFVNEQKKGEGDSILLGSGDFVSGQNKVKVILKDMNPAVKNNRYFLGRVNGVDNIKTGLLADEFTWTFSPSSVIKDECMIKQYNLSAYPNPFNNSCLFTFELQEESEVELSIYNSNGQLVEKNVKSFYHPGRHSFTFNGDNCDSGIYVFVINVNGIIQSHKVVMVK